jgi:hypothetical protein
VVALAQVLEDKVNAQAGRADKAATALAAAAAGVSAPLAAALLVPTAREAPARVDKTELAALALAPEQARGLVAKDSALDPADLAQVVQADLVPAAQEALAQEAEIVQAAPAQDLVREAIAVHHPRRKSRKVVVGMAT